MVGISYDGNIAEIRDLNMIGGEPSALVATQSTATVGGSRSCRAVRKQAWKPAKPVEIVTPTGGRWEGMPPFSQEKGVRPRTKIILRRSGDDRSSRLAGL